MSIVIACATPNRVVVKCDGRSRGTINSEDIVKFRKFRDCIMGFTGNLEFCQIAASVFLEISQKYENDFLALDEFRKTIFDATQIRPSNSQFLFTGESDKGIAIFTINAPFTEGDCNILIPEPGCISVSIIGDTRISSIPYNIHPSSIEKDMNSFIRDCASKIDSINDHIFTAKIQRASK